jgi:hypothetical protein
MFSKSLGFVRSNVHLCIMYVAISIVMLVISNNIKGALLFIFLVCYALLSLNFFITGSELIKEKSITKSSKETFLRFDKDIIVKLVILMVFLYAIILIFRGPMIFITMTPLKDKITAILSVNYTLSMALRIIIVLFSSFYKMFFLALVANVIYFKGDTIKTLINGFKTTFKLKTLLLFVILIGAAGTFIPATNESRMVIAYCEKVIDIFIRLFIFLMAFYYYKGLENNPSPMES